MNTPPPLHQDPNNAGQDPVVEEIDLSALQVEEVNAPIPKQKQAPQQRPQRQMPQQQASLPSLPKREHKKSFNFKALILSFCVIGGVVWYVTSNTDLIGTKDDGISAMKNKNWGTELKPIETPQEEHLFSIIKNRKPEKNEPLDELVKALEAVDNVNLYFQDSYSILSLVVANNDTAAVKLLLQAKANPDLEPKVNLLNIAIEEKNISILNLLLDAGASPYPNKARKDSAPLFNCLNYSYVEGTKALLSHGCDPNVKIESPKGESLVAPIPPLFCSVVCSKENKQELCSLLIKHGKLSP